MSKCIDVRLERMELRVARSGDKHELGKFHVMLAADSAFHVRSKGQTKMYRSTVNHLKSLETQKYSSRVDGPT